MLSRDAITAVHAARTERVEVVLHAVETAIPLRALGFRKDEANAAIEKTRAHVGTAQLTLAQWIRIALSYGPRLLG